MNRRGRRNVAAGSSVASQSRSAVHTARDVVVGDLMDTSRRISRMCPTSTWRLRAPPDHLAGRERGEPADERAYPWCESQHWRNGGEEARDSEGPEGARERFSFRHQSPQGHTRTPD